MKYYINDEYIGEKKCDGFYCHNCRIFSLQINMCLNCFTECSRIYSFSWENISFYFQIKKLNYDKDNSIVIKDEKNHHFTPCEFTKKVLANCPLPYLPKIRNASGRQISTVEFQLELLSCC